MLVVDRLWVDDWYDLGRGEVASMELHVDAINAGFGVDSLLVEEVHGVAQRSGEAVAVSRLVDRENLPPIRLGRLGVGHLSPGTPGWIGSSVYSGVSLLGGRVPLISLVAAGATHVVVHTVLHEFGGGHGGLVEHSFPMLRSLRIHIVIAALSP